jgi:Zn-dependent protease with chaperone function
VLDPTWQSPYTPSAAERHINEKAVRRFVLRKRMPQTIIASVLALALIAGVFVVAWLPALGVAVALVYGFDLRRSLAGYERRGQSLGAVMLESFKEGGTSKDRQRLVTVIDRLAATFGVNGVNAFIVDDTGYNAALVPNGDDFSLFVTSALMRDFELIELEGVVAHCLARQRLGLLSRESVASATPLSDENRRLLAGTGMAYRADEVAAAAIRYPLGLAGALRKCAAKPVPRDSFFATAKFNDWRWIWFDVWCDRAQRDLSDLDDVEIRALALEEW